MECIILLVRIRASRRRIMENVATTRMSSRGQVVIPDEIRKRLKLKRGCQFAVLGQDDVVILKAISPPSMAEFDSLIAEARRQARAAGLRPSQITAAIAKVRARK
jgi:AbrB family looped-hinge helix DNA binding protein